MRYSSRRNRKPPSQEPQEQAFFSKRTNAPLQKKEEQTPFFQAKGVAIGQPGDKYEQEADKMADAVVNSSGNEPAIHKKEISSIQRESLATPLEDERLGTAEQRMEKDKLVQEKPEIQQVEKEPEEPEVQMMEKEEEPEVQKMAREEREEEEPEAVQTKPASDAGTVASPSLSAKLESSKGKGKPLQAGTRREMESGFGVNFSGVRIHTDGEAVQLNKGLHAQAFTHGSDIYFNTGKYRPEAVVGKYLLAHELTHVVQQGARNSKKSNSNSIQKQELETGMTVSQRRAEGPYGWNSSYNLEITGDTVSIVVNIRIVPDAGVTAEEVNRVSRATKREFLRYFDQRFNLVDENGHSRILTVELNYVNSGENLTVNLHAGAGRDNRTNWFVDSAPVDRAHELGHQIGLLDEYIDPKVPNRATAGSPGVHTDSSIMGNYYSEGISGADVRPRHGEMLANDISAATGRSFTSEWSNIYVVRQGDNLSWIAKRIYGDSAKWQEIYRLNRNIISDPNLIYPGQQLQLPPN